MLELWATLYGVPIGNGPIFTTETGDIVLQELGQFSSSSVVLASSDRRAGLAMQPYTLIEVVQPGVGTLTYGYVLNPKLQIRDNEDGTITLELWPLTVEATWYTTRRGWVASNFLGTIAQRLGALIGNDARVPAWIGRYVDGATFNPAFTAKYEGATVLAAWLQLAKDSNNFARLGADSSGAPTRVLEMGQFAAAATVALVSADGGDAEKLATNGKIRLVAAFDYEPNNVQALVNVATPLGGGTGDTQVSLERLWRILNDLTYPNYGRFPGGPNISKGSVFDAYDPHYPIAAPPGEQAGQFLIDHGPVGSRTALLNGRYDYDVYDAASVAQWGTKRGPYTDSSLNYADSSVANQELTAQALYVSMIAYFKRHSQPHHVVTCTTPGLGRPPRAGDLVTVDYTRVTSDMQGAVIEAAVLEDVKVQKVVRRFQGESMPMDTYTLSNLGRFEDDQANQISGIVQQMQAIQIDQRTQLALFPIAAGPVNVDALHPYTYYIYLPPQVFRVTLATLRIDFSPYRATSKTSVNMAGTPITFGQPVGFTVPHGTHSVDGAFDPVSGKMLTSSDGFAYASDGTDPNAAVVLLLANDGGQQPLGQRVDVILHTPSGSLPYYTLGSGAVPQGSPVNVPAKITFTKTQTATSHTVPLNKGVLTAASLAALLPQHVHDFDQRIPDGLSPVSITVGINGNPLSSGVVTTSGTRDPVTGAFTSSCQLGDFSQYVDQPGQVIALSFQPGTSAANQYGSGAIQISGTWMLEVGGLTSNVRAG